MSDAVRYLGKDRLYKTPMGVDVKICWEAVDGDLDRIDHALLSLGFEKLRHIGFRDGRRYTEAHQTPTGIAFHYETLNVTPDSPEEAIK